MPLLLMCTATVRGSFMVSSTAHSHGSRFISRYVITDLDSCMALAEWIWRCFFSWFTAFEAVPAWRREVRRSIFRSGKGVTLRQADGWRTGEGCEEGWDAGCKNVRCCAVRVAEGFGGKVFFSVRLWYGDLFGSYSGLRSLTNDAAHQQHCDCDASQEDGGPMAANST
jgi:hypothetical protein